MKKISSAFTSSLLSMISAATFMMLSSAANAQVVPFDPNAVVAITSDPQSFIDGDGLLLVNTATGTIRLQDAGAQFQAFANMNLSIHLASGQSVPFNYIAQAPRGGSSRPRQLPGVWFGVPLSGQSQVVYLGRPQRGNAPNLQSQIFRGPEMGIRFEDGCCGRPGPARIGLQLLFTPTRGGRDDGSQPGRDNGGFPAPFPGGRN